MSEEELPKRKIEEVHQEYTRLCAQAGDMGYKIECFKDDLAMLHTKMRVLNQEGAAIIEENKKKEEPKKEEGVN